MKAGWMVLLPCLLLGPALQTHAQPESLASAPTLPHPQIGATSGDGTCRPALHSANERQYPVTDCAGARAGAGFERPAPEFMAASGTAMTSNRCYTPAANCILDAFQTVGSSCWCPTPFGPSFGRVK
jgi:hypothetical protein